MIRDEIDKALYYFMKAERELRAAAGVTPDGEQLDAIYRIIGRLEVLKQDTDNLTADTYVPTWQR